MPLQAHRQVEVVVGGVGIVGRRLHKQLRAVVALPAHRHPFVVHHLGQRQNPRHLGKCLLGLRIVAGEQQRQAAVVAGLQPIGAFLSTLAKAVGGLLVLLAVVVFAAQRHPCRAEIRAQLAPPAPDAAAAPPGRAR